MSRIRPRKALFVRPPEGRAVSDLYRFAVPREGALELPVAMLAEASEVKFHTGHRVVVQDARRADRPDSIGAACSVLRPDVAVVFAHPACWAESMEAARALRRAGADLVFGAGAGAELLPRRLFRPPEFDGLLAPGALPEVLDALGRGVPPDALPLDRSGPRPPLRVDRKLLDYARYTELGGPLTLPRPQPLRPVAGPAGVPLSDKGRFAASDVLCCDAAGRPLAVERVRADLRECVLLGIARVRLATGGGPAPPAAFWEELAAGGPVSAGLRSVHACLPVDAVRGDLLQALGLHAVELEARGAGGVEALLEAGRNAREGGAAVGVDLLLEEGVEPSAVRRALERLADAGIHVRARVAFPIAPTDPPGAVERVLYRGRPEGEGVDERLAVAAAVRPRAADLPGGPGGLRGLVDRVARRLDLG